MREGEARLCALRPAMGHSTTPLRGPTLEHMSHDTPEQQPGGEATHTPAAAAAAAEKTSSSSSSGGGSCEVEPGSLPQFITIDQLLLRFLQRSLYDGEAAAFEARRVLSSADAATIHCPVLSSNFVLY
ncbi:unnamed protein product [Ectocarpus sp. CCAP 1310/34]|nr:unnamed protein product [Ectocarpus sp. CCAP 1310/34]